VGLGNPGPEYEDTRHNAGFRLADRLAARWQLGQFRRGDRAREARGIWQDVPVRILKPQTYMNRSGAALAPLRVLQRQDYARLRIGVGPAPPGLDDLADFVLDEFTAEERDTITQLLDPMCEAVEAWLQDGIEMAMNRFNR
jgi:PTH1 family peptidyl-tRNA hydrolase